MTYLCLESSNESTWDCNMHILMSMHMESRRVIYGVKHKGNIVATLKKLGYNRFTTLLVSAVQQSKELSSLRYIAGSHQLFYTWQCIYTKPNLPVCPSFPHSHVHMSNLSICISIPAREIGSPVPCFQIPRIYINIQYLFFSLTLYSTENYKRDSKQSSE